MSILLQNIKKKRLQMCKKCVTAQMFVNQIVLDMGYRFTDFYRFLISSPNRKKHISIANTPYVFIRKNRVTSVTRNLTLKINTLHGYRCGYRFLDSKMCNPK